MKKLMTLVLGCLLCGTSTAFAQSGVKFPSVKSPGLYSKHMQRMSTEQQKDRVDEVVNDEKELGVKMWGVTNVQHSKNMGPFYFYSKDLNNLHHTGLLGDWTTQDPDRRWNLSSGAWHNGKYYGYIYYRFDLGYHAGLHFVEFDLEKGTWVSLQNLKQVPENNTDGVYWNPVEAMASDPVSGKLIGVSHSRTGFLKTEIGEVDTQTGSLINPTVFNDFYQALAFDSKGTLYAIRPKLEELSGQLTVTGTFFVKLDPNNNYKEIEVHEMTLDDSEYYLSWPGCAAVEVNDWENGTSWVSWEVSLNSMYFDPETDELWALLVDLTSGAVRQSLFTIDVETGALTKHGGLGQYNDLAKGLYIPGTKPDAFDAPSYVTNISSTYDETGKVTLTWTNPTLAFDKTPLTELAEVRIYRDGKEDANLVATLTNVTPGQEMTWTDETAEQGLHVYYIIPCRKAGVKGVEESWRAFSGRDVPGQPVNIALEKLDKATVKLTWEAAEHGANDGWYDKAGVTYTVVRQPGDKKVAEGLKELTYTDNVDENMQYYHYQVYGVTSDGEGTLTTTEEVLAGQAYKTPYSADFSNPADGAQWVAFDANQNGYKFAYDTFWKRFDLTCSAHEDDYAISPDITLEAGKTYKAIYGVYFHMCATDVDPEFCNMFRLTVGQGQTADAQTEELFATFDYQTYEYYEVVPIEVEFTPETSGVYNFALNVCPDFPEYDNIIGLSTFEVYEMQDNDLEAVELKGPFSPSKGWESKYTVTVKNRGTVDTNGCKVQVVRYAADQEVVLGETTVTDVLKADKTVDIDVIATPDVVGTVKIAGKIILDSDPLVTNNTTPDKEVRVADANIPPYNLEIDGDFQSSNTRYGISFYKYYSQQQHIYYPEEFGEYVKDGQDILIHRVALEYDNNGDEGPVTTPFDVKIYLSTTDEMGYDDERLNWLPLSEMTLVHEGKHTTMDGKGNKLSFDFSEPFRYNPSTNLVITFVKEGLHTKSYPCIFRAFNDDWTTLDRRTLRFEANETVEPEVGVGGTSLPMAPYVEMAVTNEVSSGIQTVTLGGGTVDFADGKFTFRGIDAATLTVFDVSGRLVAEEAVKGNTADANLAAGVYVVKVADMAGNTLTKKIVVRK